eukprot:383793_1
MALETGSYSWKIEDEVTMNKILNCKVGDKFKSDVFEIGKLEFRIILCPNGLNTKNKNKFCIYLRLLTMSDKWKYIILCQNIYCNETMNGCTAIVQYERNGQSKGSINGLYLLSKLKQEFEDNIITSITAKISLTILKIVLKTDYILYKHHLSFKSYYNNKQIIKWNINNKILINKIKNAYPGQPFEHKQNNNWRLVCYPNGNTHKYQGYTGLYLTLCGLPKNVLKINVEYTFKCKQTNTIKTDSQDFAYGVPSVGIAKFVELKELMNYDEFNLSVEIKILKQYDYDGNEISEIDHVWSQYLLYQKGVISNDSNDESEEFLTESDNDEKKENNIIENVSEQDNKLIKQNESNRSVLLKRTKSFAEFSYNDIQQKFAEFNDKMEQFDKKVVCIQSDINIQNSKINKRISELPLQFDGKNQDLMLEFERQRDLYNKRFELFSSNIDHNNSLMRQLKNDHSEMKQEISDVITCINDLKWAIIEEQKLDENDIIINDNKMKKDIEIKQNDEESDDYEADSNEHLDDWNKIKLWMKNDVELPQYLDLFIENDLDSFQTIKDLTKDGLKEIGIKSFAHRRKIMKFVEKMNKGQYTV